MEKKLNLKCWNCGNTFKLIVDIEGQPLFLEECPTCRVECAINLNPYYQPTTFVLRGRNQDELNLPKEIPTSEPDKED